MITISYNSRSHDDPCDPADLSKIFRRAETELSVNNEEEQQYALLYVTVSAIHDTSHTLNKDTLKRMLYIHIARYGTQEC